jgi:transketolase
MLKIKTQEYRKRILELAHRAGKRGVQAHVGGSLSCIEIIAVLYSKLKKDNNYPDKRDRFILSKGHAALAHYCVLEANGYITRDQIETFEENGTIFYTHSKRNLELGIDFSGGSLGLGLSHAIGVSLACREKKLDNKVYVLIGDGECNEGIIWEAAMSAVNFELDNLIVIIDKNDVQLDGLTKDVMKIKSLKDIFNAFGFATIEIDGHSVSEIEESLEIFHSKKPLAIIANTTKGKGVSEMENNHKWHQGLVNDKVLEKAIEEINDDNG